MYKISETYGYHFQMTFLKISSVLRTECPGTMDTFQICMLHLSNVHFRFLFSSFCLPLSLRPQNVYACGPYKQNTHTILCMFT